MSSHRGPKARTWLTVAMMLAAWSAGCEEVQVSGPVPPKPLPPEAFTPTTNVQTVVAVTGEMTARDTDHDGVPDMVLVNCFLFPSRVPTAGLPPVVGKGSFRFEIYNVREPASSRKPLIQVNYNAEQIARYQTEAWGMPAYAFQLPLDRLPPNVPMIFIKARFFPEGASEDEEPVAGGTTAVVTSTSPGPAGPLRPPTAVSPSPTTGPDTRVIRITPREPPPP